MAKFIHRLVGKASPSFAIIQENMSILEGEVKHLNIKQRKLGCLQGEGLWDVLAQQPMYQSNFVRSTGPTSEPVLLCGMEGLVPLTCLLSYSEGHFGQHFITTVHRLGRASYRIRVPGQPEMALLGAEVRTVNTDISELLKGE